MLTHAPNLGNPLLEERLTPIFLPPASMIANPILAPTCDN